MSAPGMFSEIEEVNEYLSRNLPNIRVSRVVAYGTTGVVYIGESATQAKYAVKVMKAQDENAIALIKTESKIHAAMAHQHITALRWYFIEPPKAYLLMDYAENRELFTYIDLGKGISDDLSHLYLRQLYSALRHIHSLGVCHRDIKPENILLDKNYNLLLSDFGCSTLYRDKRVRRRLTRQCGSPNYMAPDIFCGDYDGELVDVWSFGMVALVLWTGVVPWSKPCLSDPAFEKYRLSRSREVSPFNRLSQEKLQMIERMLAIDPAKRCTLSEIGTFPWMSTRSIYTGPDGLIRSPECIASKLLPALDPGFSQPDICISPIGKEYSSQPVFMSYDTNPIPTRIYSIHNTQTTKKILIQALEDVLIQYKAGPDGISFTTVDSSKNLISGEIICRAVGQETLLIFQRTRGDCLEFKRMFNAVKDRFIEITETPNLTNTTTQRR
ncbi:serine/threonine-protein kinase CHEK1 [Nematocida sp. AWRm80]|nr:serine/threonine-protein kinase CHEK1 [Nematocida sp. AWRm80]